MSLNKCSVSELRDNSNWSRVGHIYFFKSKEAFEVKPSDIPNAGSGLYALQDIKKNKTFSMYDGKDIGKASSEFYASTHFLKLRCNSKLGSCLQQINGRVIDGTFGQSGSQFINDISVRVGTDKKPRNKVKHGARKYNSRQTTSGTIASVRKILKGEEIFMDYGNEYWDFEKNKKRIVETLYI